MASGSEVLTSLLFKISADSAELKRGLDKAQSQINGFSQGVSKLKGLIAGAFTVTAILGAAKAVFDFASEIDGVIGKLDDLGQSIDLALNAGKAKAIADVFGTDIDQVIKAANATAVQFGISMTKSLEYIQQGIALAGTDTTKYLKSLEQQAAAFNESGGSADQYFAIVTNGYRNSTQWEQELKIGRSENVKTFGELTAQMNEGQIIQQNLINSSAELNKIWAETFDGTGDGVDRLKTSLNEIAVGALTGIKTGLRNISNFFIDLYNNSMLFRGVIQAIVLNFKLMWETIKMVFSNFFTLLKGAGELLKAVFTGNFSEIPNILKKYLNEAVDNVAEFGKNSAEGFKDAFDNVANNKPISLISEEKAVEQGVNAAKNFNKGFASVPPTQPAGIKTDPNDLGGLTNVTMPDFSKSIDSIAKYRAEQEATNTAIAESNRLYSEMESYEDMISNIADTASEAIVSFGENVISSNADSSKSFKDLAKNLGQSVKKMIASALAASIASSIKSAMESSGNPLLGLIIAGIATAGVIGLFSAIPAFATGTQNTKSPFFIAGESQGRGELVTNFGNNGSRVYNHAQTKSMLNTGMQPIVLTAKLRGEDMYLSNQETIRRRGYTV